MIYHTNKRTLFKVPNFKAILWWDNPE